MMNVQTSHCLLKENEEKKISYKNELGCNEFYPYFPSSVWPFLFIKDTLYVECKKTRIAKFILHALQKL